MSDDLDPRPHYPLDAEQVRLRLAWERRKAAEEYEIAQRKPAILEAKGPIYQDLARKLGVQHPDDLGQIVEAMAQNAAIDQARSTIRHETIDVTQLADDLIEKRDLINEQQFNQAQAQRAIEAEQRDHAQRIRDARTAAAKAEPLPGSVAQFDAALAARAEQRHDQWLGQKQRLNNADMDRLAEHGPQGRNYGLLRQSAAAAPEPSPSPAAPAATPAMVNGAMFSSTAFTITQASTIDHWQPRYHDAPSPQPEAKNNTNQPTIESKLSRVLPEPVQTMPAPTPQPAPQPAQRQADPPQDRQQAPDQPHDREGDGPKPDPRREPDVSPERKQDTPTPLGEVTDQALMRVIKRDITSRQSDGQELENRQGSHAAWTFRPRP